MGYTKEQIRKLGVRPRERKVDPETGMCQFLPCERREIRAVVRDILDDRGDAGRDELWQYWRLIPFEEGYASTRRKEYEDWVLDEVENMWYDIGRPVFDPSDGTWSCPEGGWWPYLDRQYLDISWLKVGNAIIDMDEVWGTLRNMLEEKVRGYRMCPGLALYRVVREWLFFEDEVRKGKGAKSAKKGKLSKVDIELRRDLFMWKIAGLVQDHPTDASRNRELREWYNCGRVPDPWKESEK